MISSSLTPEVLLDVAYICSELISYPSHVHFRIDRLSYWLSSRGRAKTHCYIILLTSHPSCHRTVLFVVFVYQGDLALYAGGPHRGTGPTGPLDLPHHQQHDGGSRQKAGQMQPRAEESIRSRGTLSRDFKAQGLGASIASESHPSGVQCD